MSRKAPAGSAMPIRVAAEQLRMVPIDDLVPYANNARTHGKAQIAQLRASLREFGFVVPVVIDGANNVIAGHGRLLAARAEGMTEVPCILAGCLTEAQRKAYILADNRLSEAASWDKELLRLELAALEKLNFHTEVIGFDTAALEEIPVSAYTRAAPGQAAPEAEPEAGAEECADQVPEACPYRPGDVFKLGRHLLVCGDCTNPEVTKNFRGGGRPATH